MGNETQMHEFAELSTRLGAYDIEAEVGQGSFASVYKARTRDDDQQTVAIKAVDLARLSKSERLFQNLKLEIAIQKTIHHENVVGLRDIIVHTPSSATLEAAIEKAGRKKRSDESVYLVLEYCDQGDLGLLLKRVRADEKATPGRPRLLSEPIVKEYLGQIGRALEVLKRMNFIHRDIKPQNILLASSATTPKGPDLASKEQLLAEPLTTAYLASLTLKLGDFGFARYMSSFDLAETLCGSPLYMAPEILSYKKYNYKVDLWSLGCILYELLFGHPPYRAANHIALLKKIKAWPIELVLQQERTPISVPAKALLVGLLQSDPAKRFSFDDFMGHDFMQQRPASPRARITPALTIPTPGSTDKASVSPAGGAPLDVLDQMSQLLTTTRLTTRRFSASSISSCASSFRPSTYTAPGLDAYFPPSHAPHRHGAATGPREAETSASPSGASGQVRASPLFGLRPGSGYGRLQENEERDFVVISKEDPQAPSASQLKRTVLSYKRTSLGDLTRSKKP